MRRLDDIHEFEEEMRRLIDIREQIGREITACRGCIGENTRRREKLVDSLQEEYNRVQSHILELDAQMRANRSARTHTTN
ncbi:MAG: hypothetical protein FJ006_12385 [Chloroflexi bacterium]|nr:hypothetical protein [Chloroflexota bacterium]